MYSLMTHLIRLWLTGAIGAGPAPRCKGILTVKLTMDKNSIHHLAWCMSCLEVFRVHALLQSSLAEGEYQLLHKMHCRISIIRDIHAKYLSVHLYIMKT